MLGMILCVTLGGLIALIFLMLWIMKTNKRNNEDD